MEKERKKGKEEKEERRERKENRWKDKYYKPTIKKVFPCFIYSTTNESCYN